MRRLKLLAAVLAATLAGCAPAVAENRLALVIGDDAYQHIAPLEKAKADAKAYAEALRDKGFRVREGYDLSFMQLNGAIASFVDSIQPGDTAVFVYSGHGWSDGTQNYLVSVDAPASASEDELAGETTPIRNGVNGVLDRIERKGAGLRVAIIDACRDNPFTPPPGQKGYSFARGLAPMAQPPQGTFVVFSASAGQTALDRLSAADADPNSVFTRVFLPLLRSDVSLQEAVKASQEKVVALARAADHDQKPSYWDEVVGPACLGECRTTSPLPPVSATPIAPIAQTVEKTPSKSPTGSPNSAIPNSQKKREVQTSLSCCLTRSRNPGTEAVFKSEYGSSWRTEIEEKCREQSPIVNFCR
jgi:hypothetical protein